MSKCMYRQLKLLSVWLMRTPTQTRSSTRPGVRKREEEQMPAGQPISSPGLVSVINPISTGLACTSKANVISVNALGLLVWRPLLFKETSKDVDEQLRIKDLDQGPRSGSWEDGEDESKQSWSMLV